MFICVTNLKNVALRPNQTKASLKRVNLVKTTKGQKLSVINMFLIIWHYVKNNKDEGSVHDLLKLQHTASKTNG